MKTKGTKHIIRSKPLPFLARSRHKGLRTAFADALQTRCVNLVGYYNVDVKAGKFSMIALNIDPMNEGKTYTLDELFPYNDKMSANASQASADEIRTWDFANQTYRYFFMYKNAFQASNPKNYKWVETTSGNPLADVAIKPGDAVFYYPKNNDNSFSIPGQVPNEAVGVLKQGFNMIGVGFPAQWNPNDAGTDYWSSADFSQNAAQASADEIRYWDEAKQTYRYFFLYKNAFQASNPKNYKWVETTSGNPVLEEPLATGAGFFFYKKKAGEIEFKPGLKLN